MPFYVGGLIRGPRFDGKKIVRDGHLSTFVNIALTSTKGSGTRKLNIHLQSATVGVSRANIQCILDRCEMYQLLKIRFTNNRVNIRPIRAKRVHDRHQVDLIDVSKWPVQHHGKTFRYILLVIDVFSRYLWLRQLPSKDSSMVARELFDIFVRVTTLNLKEKSNDRIEVYRKNCCSM